MKEEYRTFFHLGLPKVASTYLQKDIFPHLNNATFFRKHKFLKYQTIKNKPIASNLIFSSEKDKGLEEALDDILRHHPEARVIYVVRTHEEWILSRYKYHIRKFGSIPFEDYIDIDSNNGFWKTEQLLFSKKIEYIIDHCKHPPLILNYDLLRSSPALFVKKISNYTGCSLDPSAKINVVRNKSFTEKQLLLLRKFNRMYKYQEKKTKCHVYNRLHYRYRQYLLHIMAFIFRFFPAAFAKGTLVGKDELTRIREFYKADWDLCLKYSE